MDVPRSYLPLPPIPRHNPPRTGRPKLGHPVQQTFDDDEDDDTPLALMKPPKKRANPFSQTSSVSHLSEAHSQPNASFANDRPPTSSRAGGPSPPTPSRIRSEVDAPLSCNYATCRVLSDSREALNSHLVFGHPDLVPIKTVLGNLPAFKRSYGGLYFCPVKKKARWSVCDGRKLRIDQLESHVVQCAVDTMAVLASRSTGQNTGNDHRLIGWDSKSSQDNQNRYEQGPSRSQQAFRPSPPPSPADRPIMLSPELTRWTPPVFKGPPAHRSDSQDDGSSVPAERPPKRPLPSDPADASASSSGQSAKTPSPALRLAERFSDVNPRWKNGISGNERQQRAFERHWIDQLIPLVEKGEQRVCLLCNRGVYLGPKDLEAAESVYSECEIHLSGQHTDEWDSILDGSAFKVASPPSA